MRDFGQMLQELLDSEPMSHEALSDRLGYKARGTCGHWIRGRSAVPLDKAEEAAAVLGLDGDDRSLFLVLAALTHVRNEAVQRELVAFVYLSQEVPALREQALRAEQDAADLRDALKARANKAQ